MYTLKKINEFYYLLTDESPYPNDWVYSSVSNTVVTFTDPRFFGENTIKKVIASTKPYEDRPSIYMERLFEHLQGNGAVDKANKIYPLNISKNELTENFDKFRYGFIQGYSEALKDNSDKKFTSEEMKKAMFWAMNCTKEDGGFTWQQEDGFISSLSKERTEWVVEIEEEERMKKVNGPRVPGKLMSYGEKFMAPKITDGCIHLTKIIM